MVHTPAIRPPRRSRCLAAAALITALVVPAGPAAAQFTATVTGPAPARVVKLQSATKVTMPRDTVRPTVLSDLKAWVDSAAGALRNAPPAAPGDTTAKPERRPAADSAADRPKPPTRPRRR
jgi:hypothetical protein